jgi:Protein of unknown function (DUF1091)
MDVNKKLGTLAYDKENETHWGALRVELYENVNGAFGSSSISDSHRTFFENSVNLCKWLKDPRSRFVVAGFKIIFKDFDPELLNCPVRKGKYVVKGPSPKNRVIEKELPAFIRLEYDSEERLNYTINVKVRVGKILRDFATVTDILAWR